MGDINHHVEESKHGNSQQSYCVIRHIVTACVIAWETTIIMLRSPSIDNNHHVEDFEHGNSMGDKHVNEGVCLS